MDRRRHALVTVLAGGGDSVAPTVVITSSETSPTTAKPVPITITFSEAVTGFEVGDITAALSSGTVALSGFAGSGTTYTVNATPSLSNGTMTFDIAAEVAEDAAGNKNTAATQFSMVYDNRIVYDEFTGTNGTSIASHTPNIDLAAGGWNLTVGAAIQIQSNRAKGAATPSYPGNLAWIETNAADCVVSCVIRLTTNINAGLILRFVDSDNTLIVMIVDIDNQFIIRKREGGVNSDLAVANVAISPDTDYIIRVVLSGSSITATLDGGSEISATSTFNLTSTKHGVQLRDGTQIADDFLVVGNF